MTEVWTSNPQPLAIVKRHSPKTRDDPTAKIIIRMKLTYSKAMSGHHIHSMPNFRKGIIKPIIKSQTKLANFGVLGRGTTYPSVLHTTGLIQFIG
jgi:hypothetical protein